MNQVVFVQISDTHFGPDLLNQRFGWIRGYREHDVTLLTAFQSALRDVRRVTKLHPTDSLYVLHSGDVTATGAPGEFSSAELYFHGQRPFSYSRPQVAYGLGLAARGTDMTKIPGNHDHWDGRKFRWGPYNQTIFGRYFRPLPWCWTLWSGRPAGNGKQVVVELFGADSNSGLRDLSRWSSVRAKGHISDQEFERLTELLEAKKEAVYENAHVVRAFVVHHPLSLRRHNPFIKALYPASVRRLLELADEFDVFAVLDGHTHRFHYASYNVPRGGGRQLHELRSATTFQGPARDRTQGFIAHQLLAEDGHLVWKAWQYKFDGSGFACAFIQPSDQPWWMRTVQ